MLLWGNKLSFTFFLFVLMDHSFRNSRENVKTLLVTLKLFCMITSLGSHLIFLYPFPSAKVLKKV